MCVSEQGRQIIGGLPFFAYRFQTAPLPIHHEASASPLSLRSFQHLRSPNLRTGNGDLLSKTQSRPALIVQTTLRSVSYAGLRSAAAPDAPLASSISEYDLGPSETF